MLSNTPGLRPSDYSFLTWTPDQPAKAGDQQTSCRWVPDCDMGSPLTVSGTSQVLPWSKPPWVQANRPHSQQLYRWLGCLSHWNIKSSLWGIRIAPLLPFLLGSNHPVVLYHGNTWICNCNKGRNCHLFMAYNCIGNIYIFRVTTKDEWVFNTWSQPALPVMLMQEDWSQDKVTNVKLYCLPLGNNVPFKYRSLEKNDLWTKYSCFDQEVFKLFFFSFFSIFGGSRSVCNQW